MLSSPRFYLAGASSGGRPPPPPNRIFVESGRRLDVRKCAGQQKTGPSGAGSFARPTSQDVQPIAFTLLARRETFREAELRWMIPWEAARMIMDCAD